MFQNNTLTNQVSPHWALAGSNNDLLLTNMNNAMTDDTSLHVPQNNALANHNLYNVLADDKSIYFSSKIIKIVSFYNDNCLLLW